MPRQDTPHEPDEPDVRLWPRAWRLIFLVLAGGICWVLVVVVAGYVRRRLGL